MRGPPSRRDVPGNGEARDGDRRRGGSSKSPSRRRCGHGADQCDDRQDDAQRNERRCSAFSEHSGGLARVPSGYARRTGQGPTQVDQDGAHGPPGSPDAHGRPIGSCRMARDDRQRGQGNHCRKDPDEGQPSQPPDEGVGQGPYARLAHAHDRASASTPQSYGDRLGHEVGQGRNAPALRRPPLRPETPLIDEGPPTCPAGIAWRSGFHPGSGGPRGTRRTWCASRRVAVGSSGRCPPCTSRIEDVFKQRTAPRDVVDRLASKKDGRRAEGSDVQAALGVLVMVDLGLPAVVETAEAGLEDPC